MSLTRHLSNKESPIRQFIYGSAPQLAVAGTRGRQGQLMASAFGFDELTALSGPSSLSVVSSAEFSVWAGPAWWREGWVGASLNW